MERVVVHVYSLSRLILESFVSQDFTVDDVTFVLYLMGMGLIVILLLAEREVFTTKAIVISELLPDQGSCAKWCRLQWRSQINSSWRDVFLKSFKAMDKELRSHPNLDCFCSGSTAVTIVKQVDSRAIMGSKDSNDSLVAIRLTVDLKTDLP
ncbi:putative protein phosphatase 2C 52, partial [Bienertia sinuspersici]